MRNQLIESAHHLLLRQLRFWMSSDPEIRWNCPVLEMFGISLTNLQQFSIE